MKKKKKKEVVAQTDEEKKKLRSATLAMMQQQEEEEQEEEKEKKEKKKKKKSSSAASEETEKTEGGEEESLENTDFLAEKKKKKKSSKSSSATTESSETTTDAVEEKEEKVVEGTIPWLGVDRDYKYSELTYRIYHLLQTNNPDLISDQKRQMKPPQVMREGTKKTIWANFAEICGILNRKPEHVLTYVFAELGTNGSIDGNQRLVIRGRFKTSQIEVVIRHYISEYVACRNCKSPNTILERNNRLYFLCCNACNSKRSVAVIKKGLESVGKKAPKEQQ
ncbi:hypothetical protein DICPUDRAFT_46530 [Dictyostelium purpureum]|uniref:Translation initiation factor IF2/IF5 domain-containing protein n=1 Tax=Dictyostelium purpureum TaxID=5786 RepID=F0ZF66_DICPU|nr:uncharacterized protein DICPUDRAFT_46530 [Dictyostelium purpureum]EGC37399.1 hypothetical protein DICPUDRAFT_46530 [Dictyostelium purpureum]|eukprot:XP_003286052.1 hypothetical protein DICPUDRAFT_46530 [Dictyostelium purpureum]